MPSEHSRHITWSLLEFASSGDVKSCNILTTYLYQIIRQQLTKFESLWAEDAINDATFNAFVAVCENVRAGSFQSERECSLWVTRIARRKAIDAYHQFKPRYETSVFDEEEHENSSTSGADSSRVIDIAKQREAAHINKLLASLTGDERVIVFLYHYEDKSYEEIAAILGIPLGTVKSRLFRVHEKLKLLSGVKGGI